MLYVPLLDKTRPYISIKRVKFHRRFEMYSLDLQNSSSLTKLTDNQAIEEDLQLSNDRKRILFRTLSLASPKSQMNDTQGRLYSIDLSNGELQRIGANISANLVGYACQYELFVEEWKSMTFYSSFYNQCAPIYCSTYNQNNI
ncbi:unnamed protein product [Adineta ricciae]|uniref:Uncharacterized protein n=1 Tax=Adineta ricciae TaxID=249248 RepID=A0A814C5X1_ADIRI|nr:unnamed protein product [Adineta ricciae]CAF1490881.1 unnamed protein product [Adineta ricciae]